MPQNFVSSSVFICVAACFKPINLMQHWNLVCSSKIHLIWINILSPGGCRRPFCSKLVTLFSFVGDTDGTRSFQWQHQQQWESTLPFFIMVNLLLCVVESSKGCLFQEDPRYGEGTVSIKKALMSLLDGSDADETFLQKWYGNVYCCCDQSGTWVRFNLLRFVVWEQWTMLSCTVGHRWKNPVRSLWQQWVSEVLTIGNVHKIMKKLKYSNLDL